MYVGPNDKILRDEAMRRASKSDILHSSGLVNNDGVTGGSSATTYQQRQEMLRKYVGKYDKSQLGAVRNPAMRAQPVQPGQQAGGKPSRFDARVVRRKPR